MIVPGTKPVEFKMNEENRQYLLNKEVDWSDNILGLVTLYRTYLRKKEDGNLETWNEAVLRVIEGMFTIQKTHIFNTGLIWKEEKAQRTALLAAEKLFEFKWSPPGRGLWMMGTDFIWKKGGAGLNNPLYEDTPVLTQEYGWVNIGEIEGETVNVLSNTKLYGRDHQSTSAQGKWTEAIISNFETQPCYEITFQDEGGSFTNITASENHRWFAQRTTKDFWKRVNTTELNVGDRVPVTLPPKYYSLSTFGAQHGFFFGDGTRSNGELHQFNDSIDVLEKLFKDINYVDYGRGREAIVKNCPLAWSETPKGSYENDKRYVYGFLAGYFAADGHVTKSGQCQLRSSRKEELEKIRTLAFEVGIRTTTPKLTRTSSNLSDNREFWEMTFYKNDLQEQFFLKEKHRIRWAETKNKKSERRAKVIDINYVGDHRVLCATVPYYEQFVTDGFILTSNCAFVDTANIAEEGSEPFRFLMDMSMLGVGVGFDTEGHGKINVKQPKGETETVVVEDNREGWVYAIGRLIDSYLFGGNPVELDTSKVRPYGEPIQGFGGVASGPKPLVQGFNGIRDVLKNRVGELITSVDITDIQNIIGKIVVAGNVRRTAEIAFSQPSDNDFRTMKSIEQHPEKMGAAPPPELERANKEEYKEYAEAPFSERAKEIAEKYQDEPWAYKFGGWRWTSNNSLFATVGMDYNEIADSIAENGEPGLAWLENMQNYSRMIDSPDYKDVRVRGGNPCVTGDTLVAVADGRNAVPIKDLEGTQYPVYSVDNNGKVVIKNSTKTWKTRENAEIWKLVLDDDSELRATPDHKIMLRDGSYKELKDLKVGDSLYPFNSTEKHGYRNIQGTGKKASGLRQYRLITEFMNGELPDAKKFAIHHKDFNKRNDAWENLEILSHEEHNRLHCLENNPMKDPQVVERMKVTREENGLNSSENNPMYGKKHNKNSKEKISNKSVENWKNNYDSMKESIRSGMDEEARRKISQKKVELANYQDWYCPVCNKHEILTEAQANTRKSCSHSCSNRRRYLERVELWNHKVESIEFCGYEDVYDMTVEDTHNFGVITSMDDSEAVNSSGIFIHNCLEQSLEPYELCCLVETYPSKHKSAKEFNDTLKIAYLYAKTVTLMATHNSRTNTVMARNRRIGCSQSGIVDAISHFGRHYFQKNMADKAYHKIQEFDRRYSEWLGIPRSVKTTSVKPSGTVSLLANVSPGVHFPKIKNGYRTMRLAADSPIADVLRNANYHVEPSNNDPYNTVVAYFPILAKDNTPTEADSNIWEQFTNAVMMQKYWADNQVSVTVSFKNREKDQIAKCLSTFDSELKGISLLPMLEHGFPQAPYIEADRDEVRDYAKKLLPISLKDFNNIKEGEAAEANKFCDSDGCSIV